MINYTITKEENGSLKLVTNPYKSKKVTEGNIFLHLYKNIILGQVPKLSPPIEVSKNLEDGNKITILLDDFSKEIILLIHHAMCNKRLQYHFEYSGKIHGRVLEHYKRLKKSLKKQMKFSNRNDIVTIEKVQQAREMIKQIMIERAENSDYKVISYLDNIENYRQKIRGFKGRLAV